MKKQILFLVMIIAVMGVVSGCVIDKRNEAKNENVKNQVQKQDQIQLSQSATSSNQEVVDTSLDLINVSDWKVFDSEKDSGVKIHFTLNYPAIWKHEGSIDGGTSSNIPFYDIKKYSQNCYKEVNNSTRCDTAGKVFEINVSLSDNNYGVSQKEQVVKIDEYLGYIEEKKNENDEYSFIAEEVIICTIPSVDGINLEIVMDKSMPDSVNIFNEILKSIKFKK